MEWLVSDAPGVASRGAGVRTPYFMLATSDPFSDGVISP